MDDGVVSLLNGIAIVGRGMYFECIVIVRSGILFTVDVFFYE